MSEQRELLHLMIARVEDFSALAQRIQSTEGFIDTTTEAGERMVDIMRSIKNQIVTIATRMGNEILPYATEESKNARRG